MLRTVPRKSSRMMMSPTLYWFSKMMNAPVMISSIRLWAPKPRIRLMMPTPASTEAVFTPRMLRPQTRAAITATYLSSPETRLVTVPALPPRLPSAARISFTI